MTVWNKRRSVPLCREYTVGAIHELPLPQYIPFAHD